jgi:hypothetical protein
MGVSNTSTGGPNIAGTCPTTFSSEGENLLSRAIYVSSHQNAALLRRFGA